MLSMNRKRTYITAITIVVAAFIAVATSSVQSWVSIQKIFYELNANYIPVLDRISKVSIDISQARTELFRYSNNYEPSPFRIQEFLKQVQTNLLWITQRQLPQNSTDLAEVLLAKTGEFQDTLNLLETHMNKKEAILVLVTTNKLKGLSATLSSLSQTLNDKLWDHILHKNKTSQQKILSNNAILSTISFVLIFILVCGVLFQNRILQRQVQNRTVQLQDQLQALYQSEKNFRDSEEKYRKLVSNISDVIVIMDKDGIINYKSANITEHFGWSPDDLIGKHGLFTVHPDDQERIGKELTRILIKDNAKTRVEYQYLCKDGSFKPVELTAVNLVNDPIINGVLANYKDITERRQKSEELRKSEEKFRLTFLTSLDAIILNRLDDGTYLEINEGFTKIMGYSREEVIGKTSVALNIWKDPKDRDRLLSGLKKDGVIENLEAEFIGKDGQIRSGLMSAHIVKIGNDEVILSITRNITDEIRMKKVLQQSQKMEAIGTLSGGIAHDFNNILFPIVGHTEMLLDDVPEDSPFRGSLNEIYAGSLRARDLVHQILAFSRQENSELKLMKMQSIIKEALKLIRSTIPSTISIHQHMQSDCSAVKADPTQVHQIVMNLATNAYHAMEETGGELNVTLKEIQLGEHELITPDMMPGSYACLTIADTGTGIDKKTIDKIFDPFFTTKEKGRGTGMGLSVVYGIVKNMNGVIQVYSESGKGTRFHVYLPVIKTNSVKEETLTDEPIHCGTESVLLVDDEEGIIVMEEQVLQRLGYQVTSRTSSIEALEAFKANPDRFDLVITDMAMPNMAGDKLAVQLIKIRPDIPVLLCTGFSETLSEEKIQSIGVKGFLLKPIIMKDLAKKIRQVLDRHN
jgi:PAS domain S-box-containing protein